MDRKGWYSRGYLPHFDSPETVQFVTFRLGDSLPKAVAQLLAALPDNLARTDKELDVGLDACWLSRPSIAELVEAALLHFDGDRYHLLAWCIMPNHVHVVSNEVLGRSGAFWHRDYFDRYMRDEGHLSRTIEYVENNPVKAGLASESAKWRWSSARLRA